MFCFWLRLNDHEILCTLSLITIMFSCSYLFLINNYKFWGNHLLSVIIFFWIKNNKWFSLTIPVTIVILFPNGTLPSSLWIQLNWTRCKCCLAASVKIFMSKLQHKRGNTATHLHFSVLVVALSYLLFYINKITTTGKEAIGY